MDSGLDFYCREGSTIQFLKASACEASPCGGGISEISQTCKKCSFRANTGGAPSGAPTWGEPGPPTTGKMASGGLISSNLDLKSSSSWGILADGKLMKQTSGDWPGKTLSNADYPIDMTLTFTYEGPTTLYLVLPDKTWAVARVP